MHRRIVLLVALLIASALLAPHASAMARITIQSPAPGSVVGNPFVITGQVDSIPSTGDLIWLVRAADGRVVGQGRIGVGGAPGQAGTFTGELSMAAFTGQVSLTVASSDNGQVASSVALTLNSGEGAVQLPPRSAQTIAIDTPGGGARVFSPMTITGRTSRYPLSGELGYTVLDARGRSLGSGSFAVDAATPKRFRAQIRFAIPKGGGTITLRIAERDDGGAVVARASRTLVIGGSGKPAAPSKPAAPPNPVAGPAVPQQIVIDTPSFKQQVFSPMTITGRTARPPTRGRLIYQVRGADGALLGRGNFAIGGRAGQPTSFSVAVAFAIPRGGGEITLELFDIGDDDVIVGSAARTLIVR